MTPATKARTIRLIRESLQVITAAAPEVGDQVRTVGQLLKMADCSPAYRDSILLKLKTTQNKIAAQVATIDLLLNALECPLQSKCPLILADVAGERV